MVQIIKRFWWGGRSNKKKAHWVAVAWRKLTIMKDKGGMGFRDLQKFNQALLARQAWRLLVRPDSLCARIMKEKYYPNGALLDTSFPQVASPCWRSIEHGLELLKKGVVWRIGDGKQINIWRCNWLPRDNGLRVTGKRHAYRLKWVHQLWNASRTGWNVQVLNRVFWDHDIEVIRKLKIPGGQFEDVLAWHYEEWCLHSQECLQTGETAGV
jgi:hypothetical protein